MILKLKNFKISLFISAIFSIFLSQITYLDGERISLNFRYAEVLIFLCLAFFILFGLSKEKWKYRPPTLEILLFFNSLILSVIAVFFYYDIELSGVNFIFISTYVFIHNLVIVHIVFEERNSIKLVYAKYIKNIFEWSVIFAVVLYVLYFLGFNDIRLGINSNTQYGIPRMFGFSPEPSHFSVMAWIVLYTVAYELLYKPRGPIINKRFIFAFFAFFAFIFSFSTTGYMFALFTLFFSFFYIKFFYSASFFIVLIIVMFILPMDYYIRISDSVSLEFQLLYDYFILKKEFIDLNYFPSSRVISFIYELEIIFNKLFLKFGIGLGAGGQTILLNSIDGHFRGVIYVFIEYGIVGLLAIIFVLYRMFKNTTIFFKPLFLSYAVVSFFNTSGGIFSLDFLIVFYAIHLLSIDSKHSLVYKQNTLVKRGVI